MKIIISGLGKMGGQVAKKLHEGGHAVIAHNRSPEPIEAMAKLGMSPAMSKEEAIKLCGSEPAIIWISVPADAVDTELENWLKTVPAHSILIDAGNSDYRLAQKRADIIHKKNAVFLDIGVSGGAWGYKHGFSMMIGGDKQAFEKIEPILNILAAPEGGYRYFGLSGAGHFVKMTHNAIEYGMMESLAEGYRLLKEGPYSGLDLSSAGEVWQKHSVITSWLNELCATILKENPELEGIDGFVAETGEARWALETAKDSNIETSAIRAAFQVRIDSQNGKVNFATKLLAAMRNAFGGHKINK